MKSVLQKEKECMICKTTIGLHEHHVFEGWGNRAQSEKYGMKIWLCGKHHNLSNEGIHFNKDFDLAVKQMAQEYFEEHCGDREYFMRIFGRNYL